MGKEHILIIEDEDIVRESVRRVMANAGYQVDAVPSAEAGLSRLARSQEYDLLLVDLKMPRMDGLAFLRVVKARYPYLGTVVVTGYGSLEHSVQALELGALGFVLKPVSPHKLVAMVDDAISRQRGAEEAYRCRALTPLVEMSRLVTQERELESLMAASLEMVTRHTGAKWAAALLLEADGSLQPFCSRGLDRFPELSTPAAAQLCQRWAYRPQPIVFPMDDDHPLTLVEQELASVGLSHSVCTPLMTGGRVVGAIATGPCGAREEAQESDLEFLTVVSALLASATCALRLACDLEAADIGQARSQEVSASSPVAHPVGSG